MASNPPPTLFGQPLPDISDPEERWRFLNFGRSAALTGAASAAAPFALAGLGIKSLLDRDIPRQVVEPAGAMLPLGALARAAGGGLRSAIGYFGRMGTPGEPEPEPEPTPIQSPVPAVAPTDAVPSADPRVAARWEEMVAEQKRQTAERSLDRGSRYYLPETAGLMTEGGPGFDVTMTPEQRERKSVSDVEQAASTRSPTRAIRLPNGRMMFTNQPGGDEEAAAAPFTSGEGGEYRRKTYESYKDVPRATLTGLLRAQVRAAEREAAGGRPGGFSQIEGTPEQQRGLALESAMGSLDLLEAKRAMLESEQQAKLAAMEPEARLAIEDPSLRIARWTSGSITPQILAIHQEAQAERLKARAIADPKQQKIRLDEIDDDERNAVGALMATMATVSRQRLSPTI